VAVAECAELIAADLFRIAEQPGRRITFGDVERHLAELLRRPLVASARSPSRRDRTNT